MDVNNIVIENDKVILDGVKNFNIKQILECVNVLDGKKLES